MTKSKPAAHRRRLAERRGRRAERLAAFYLRIKGFKILAARYKTRLGEIDLIAMRGKCVIFAEVKARNSYDDAEFSLTAATWHRIGAASDLFIAARPALANYDRRFDAIFVLPWLKIRHIHAAWDY